MTDPIISKNKQGMIFMNRPYTEEEFRQMKNRDEMVWRNLDSDDRRPNNHEICLVWDKDLDWQFGIYITALNEFGGTFHGYNPRWWMRLVSPEEV